MAYSRSARGRADSSQSSVGLPEQTSMNEREDHGYSTGRRVIGGLPFVDPYNSMSLMETGILAYPGTPQEILMTPITETDPFDDPLENLLRQDLSYSPQVPESDEMEFGMSEHNLPTGGIDDQFRRQEQSSDLFGTIDPQVLMQPNAFCSQQQPFLGEPELSGSVCETLVGGPIQCSTPGPAVEGLQRMLGHATLNSPPVDYEPPSVCSTVSTSTIDEPVQETTVWKTVENSPLGGRAINLHMGIRTTIENSKQQLCPGTLAPIRRFNYKSDSLALPALVEPKDIKLSDSKVEVPFVLPGRSAPCTKLFENCWEEKDAGLCVMQMLFQFVRTLAKIHSHLKTGYGAFSDLECLYAQVHSLRRTRRGEEPQVVLLPVMNKLLNAAQSLLAGATEEEVAKRGRLEDIKSLGCILHGVIPLLEEMKIHVSSKILENVRRACRMCDEAFTGDKLASIVIALDCETRLCGLHMKLDKQLFDIVCYEGERIHGVVDKWLMDTTGQHLHHFHLSLYNSNDSRCCVNRDQEVCHPFSDVFGLSTLHQH